MKSYLMVLRLRGSRFVPFWGRGINGFGVVLGHFIILWLPRDLPGSPPWLGGEFMLWHRPVGTKVALFCQNSCSRSRILCSGSVFW